jgi:hypothetical protein
MVSMDLNMSVFDRHMAVRGDDINAAPSQSQLRGDDLHGKASASLQNKV